MVKKAIKIGHKDLKFTFDHRQEEYNTGVLYYDYESLEWNEHIFFDHASVWKNPKIQVADLVARETMKGLDNEIGPVKREYRKSLVALATTGKRFEFDYLHREYFFDLKSKMADLSRLSGFDESDYLRWLQKYKLGDNLQNIYRFLNWFDAEELRKEQE